MHTSCFDPWFLLLPFHFVFLPLGWVTEVWDHPMLNRKQVTSKEELFYSAHVCSIFRCAALIFYCCFIFILKWDKLMSLLSVDCSKNVSFWQHLSWLSCMFGSQIAPTYLSSCLNQGLGLLEILLLKQPIQDNRLVLKAPCILIRYLQSLKSHYL